MSQHNPPPSRPSPNNGFTPSYNSPSSSFAPEIQPPAPVSQHKQPSPFSSNIQPTLNSGPVPPVPRALSPMNGPSMNGFHAAPAAPGTMGPPSRPADKEKEKATDIRTLEDPLAGTGVNLDEEERNLTSSTYYAQRPGHNANLGPPRGPNGDHGFEGPRSNGHQAHHEQDPEALQRRNQAEADFRAARWAQNPLWDAFLLGDPVEKKLNRCAYDNGINSPKDGLFLATKGSTRPQTTQVIGHDGAKQIIDRGQTILSTESGEALGDIMKLVSLAARDRVTGLLDHSGRLACERRDHSGGRIPAGWKTVAITPPAPSAPQHGEGATASKSLKRTFSQMDEDQPPSVPHRLVSIFQKVSNAVRDSEQARVAKRNKRGRNKTAEAGPSSGPSTPSGAQTPATSSVEPEKRLTKKDRKAVQDKMSDVMQQKSANETARMAMGLGATSKFKKKYSWLNNGPAVAAPAAAAAAAAAAATPSASPSQTASKTSAGPGSAQSIPGSVSAKASLRRGKRLGDWEEREDGGIQVRDVLLVLETDGKAIKALSKAYNVPDRAETR